MDKIRNIKTGEGDLLVSLDIEKLFSSMSRKEVMRVIEEVLSSDEKISEDFKTGIKNLVDFVWSNTYFRFGEKYYKQLSSIPIGESFRHHGSEFVLGIFRK